MFESLASCFAFRCSASLNMTLPFIEVSATMRLRSAFARVSQAASDFFRPTTSDKSTPLFRFPFA
jgi:hypothetical protein